MNPDRTLERVREVLRRRAWDPGNGGSVVDTDDVWEALGEPPIPLRTSLDIIKDLDTTDEPPAPEHRAPSVDDPTPAPTPSGPGVRTSAPSACYAPGTAGDAVRYHVIVGPSPTPDAEERGWGADTQYLGRIISRYGESKRIAACQLVTRLDQATTFETKAEAQAVADDLGGWVVES